MLVIGPLGRALRGDASITPYIPFTDGTVGRGLDPSYAVCHLKFRRRGRRPRRPGRVGVIACGWVKTPPYELT